MDKYYDRCLLISGFNSDVILEWTFKVAVVKIIKWHCWTESSLLAVLVEGELLSQVLVRMMQRDKPVEMQLTSAKW